MSQPGWCSPPALTPQSPQSSSAGIGEYVVASTSNDGLAVQVVAVSISCRHHWQTAMTGHPPIRSQPPILAITCVSSEFDVGFFSNLNTHFPALSRSILM